MHKIAQTLIDEMVKQERALEAEATYLGETVTSESDNGEGVGDAEA